MKSALSKIRNDVNEHFTTIMDEIESEYLVKIGDLDIQDSINEQGRLQTILSKMTQELKSINVKSLPRFLNNYINQLKIDSFIIKNSRISNITSLSQQFNFLDDLKRADSSSWSSDWIVKVEDTQKRLLDSGTWFS